LRTATKAPFSTSDSSIYQGTPTDEKRMDAKSTTHENKAFFFVVMGHGIWHMARKKKGGSTL
jgi:hypothetical protein